MARLPIVAYGQIFVATHPLNVAGGTPKCSRWVVIVWQVCIFSLNCYAKTRQKPFCVAGVPGFCPPATVVCPICHNSPSHSPRYSFPPATAPLPSLHSSLSLLSSHHSRPATVFFPTCYGSAPSLAWLSVPSVIASLLTCYSFPSHLPWIGFAQGRVSGSRSTNG